ncbi:pectate lyase-like adhesive domain-containing protein [Carnobacterium maltaromaticum]|uniref:pectate lyase-like adhesive domain-containing protein n=1 Tax=Carnobacterium maltaromaticum TaxID=2751 RepID=UPI0039B0AF66
MSKNKKIGFTSFVVICVGLFVLAVQFSENQRLKALETNEDKNSLIELVMDSEELSKDSEFNLAVLVNPDVTKDIVLPIPEGLTFVTEQMESEVYQVNYDSSSRLMTIELSPIEEAGSENDSAMEALVQNEAERKSVVIPLAFKAENTGEYTLEAKTIYQESSLSSNQVTFAVTETEEKLELETDEVLEEPIIDAPTVDGDAPTLLRSPKSAVANVGTWTEFVAAMANTSISEINLTKNITRTVTTDDNSPGTLTRSLTIRGNNFTINFGSGGGWSKNGIMLGTVSQTTELTLDSVQFIKTDTPTTPAFDTSSGGNNWIVHLSKIKTPDANLAGLIKAVNSTVILRGKNDLSLNGKASHLIARNIIFEENSIFTSQSKATNSASAIGIQNGTVLVKKNAKVTINNAGTVSDFIGIVSTTLASSSGITGSITDFTMEPKSEVLLMTNTYGYHTVSKNNFTMTGGAKFEANVTTNGALVFANTYVIPDGLPSTINISGPGTRLKASTTDYANERIASGAITIHGTGSILNILDGAEVIGHAVKMAVLRFKSSDGQINVKNKAKLTLTQDNSTPNGISALDYGDYWANSGFQTLNVIGDSEINVTSIGNIASTIFIFGKHEINVNTRSKLKVRNYGDRIQSNGGSYSGSQGIFVSRGDADYNIKDAGSSMDIYAALGPAIEISGNSKITSEEGTSVKFSGNPYSKAVGIFMSTGISTINVNRSLFFDFKNNRTGGGAIFNVKNGSTFTSTQSDLSTWKLGTDIDGDPSKKWSLFDYKLSGENFTKIDSTNVRNEFNTGANSFGSTGASAYSRMTGGKARAVVDELRAPTNADKSIFGHVTIPLDGENGRDAFTDEAFVVVKLTKANGKSQELTGRTIGKNNNNPGLSVYGEASRGGMFKIPVPNNVFLETGDKIEVVRAWRGGADPNSKRVHLSLPEDLVAPNRTTFDITPPNPAVITNSRVVDNATKQISGKANEPGSKVEISVNGVDLATTTTVQPNGTFVFNLPHYLKKDDLVQVKVRDRAGLASAVGVDRPPSTNNAVGNGNPKTNLTFHDQIFVAAPSVIVKDVLPDTNKAVKAVVVDNNKGATQIGSVLTYTIDVENNKPAAIATNWKAVTIEDQLDKALDPDLNSFALNGTLIPATKVEYNEETKLLRVKVGDLTSKKKAKLTFNARVNKTGLNRTIFNGVTVLGNSPREVEPFEVGPENPTAAKQKIQINSNRIANPGGPVFGVLELVSTPTTISFGEDLKIAPTKQRYPVAEMSGGLTVQDSRAVKTSWSITARMTSILESPKGKKLPNAMHYTYNGTDQILGTDSIVVYQHTSTNEEPLSISDSWNVQERLNLQIPTGRVYPGRYRGTIEWTLQDTPETK